MTRTRPLRLLAAMIVLAAVVAAAAWWWMHPRAFDSYGGQVGAPVEPGGTANVNLNVPRQDLDVTIRSISVDVAENTSDAEIDLVLCSHPAAPDAVLGAGFGDLGRADCSSVRPAVGVRSVDWRRESLIVRVTPRQAGTVRITGAWVRYSRDWRHGWQTGSERTGIEVVVPSR